MIKNKNLKIQWNNQLYFTYTNLFGLCHLYKKRIPSVLWSVHPSRPSRCDRPSLKDFLLGKNGEKTWKDHWCEANKPQVWNNVSEKHVININIFYFPEKYGYFQKLDQMDGSLFPFFGGWCTQICCLGGHWRPTPTDHLPGNTWCSGLLGRSNVQTFFWPSEVGSKKT